MTTRPVNTFVFFRSSCFLEILFRILMYPTGRFQGLSSRMYTAFLAVLFGFGSMTLLPPKALSENVFTIYVAQNGNDNWSGTIQHPDGMLNDGPFLTLQRARDEIRRRKKSASLPSGGIVVEVGGGDYEFREPFELTNEDSGQELAEIVYQPRQGEKVRLTGAKNLTHWGSVNDQSVISRLNPSARPHVIACDLRAEGIFDYGHIASGAAGAAGSKGTGAYRPGMELIFGDMPMTLARWPNHDFLRVGELVGDSPREFLGLRGDRKGRFTYEGDRPARWVGEKDVMLHGYWFFDWSDQRQKVAQIDTERHVIYLEEPDHYFGYRKGQRYYAFNLLPELDAPGEYWIDRDAGVLYFWPPTAVDRSRAQASIAANIIVMRDVSHITFRGFTLEGCRDTAVLILRGSHNRIVACRIRNTGGWGVSIGGGDNNGVLACNIFQTGDGGIEMRGGSRTDLTSAGHFAENNDIHHFSRINRILKPALDMHGVGIRAIHNLIHHAPHSGIRFSGNEHLIEFNEIHDVCQETDDAGAIVAGSDWTMRGNVLRWNYLHDIVGRGSLKGIYLDNMFSSATIFGNVFYKVSYASFIGGGRDNTIENNVFVECNPAIHVDARGVGMAQSAASTQMPERLLAVPYKSPAWSSRYPKLVTILEDSPALPKGNSVLRNICWKGKWDAIEQAARDWVRFEGNLVGIYPRFVDEKHHNYQLQPDSPAYALGFKRIPIEKIGLVQDDLRASLSD